MIQHKMSLSRQIGTGLFLMMLLVGIPMTGFCAQRSSGQPVASNPADAPKAVFPEITYDFGTILEGDKVQYDFIVENQGTAPLKISKVQPD